MKVLIWTGLILVGLQVGCISGDEINYVEGTYDEYYRLHWEPFVKENEKDHNEKRFQRRQMKPVVCTKEVLNNLPEECEIRNKKARKKRRRRF